MKNEILNLGKVLNKSEQKNINGGDNCNFYEKNNLCFATDDPHCIPCNQINNYPDAQNCHNIDYNCFE
jgi:hypothetical protein